jgi:hypothetical protein
MYGLLITQSIDIKENGFCNIITKSIFMSLNGLNLSNYGYIMSMYGFSDKLNTLIFNAKIETISSRI